MPVPEIQVRNAEQRTLSAEADRLFLAGAYHSGDPNDNFITDSMLSGCALGIADVDHIDKVSFEGAANRLGLADPTRSRRQVTSDNLAIFSVQQDCVKQRYTTFDVPARMPACTGAKCICSWCE